MAGQPAQPKLPGGLGLDLFITLLPAWLSMAVGFAALILYTWLYKISWAGFLWALACTGAGSLIGIVFGVPRSAGDSVSSFGDRHSALHPNTNMEQISDWLTKLLVGAGLVELKDLSRSLNLAAQYVARALASEAMKPGPALTSVAAALIIYFCVEGFIAGYLVSRVFFPIAFHDADRRVADALVRQGPATPPDPDGRSGRGN